MRLSPFPWATIRWPKAPTGSVGGSRAVRVTSHTQTDRAAVTGSHSLSPESHLMAAVFGVPFALIWLCAGFYALAVPEIWLVALVALPFVVWRYRVYRGTRSRRHAARH